MPNASVDAVNITYEWEGKGEGVSVSTEYNNSADTSTIPISTSSKECDSTVEDPRSHALIYKPHLSTLKKKGGEF